MPYTKRSEASKRVIKNIQRMKRNIINRLQRLEKKYGETLYIHNLKVEFQERFNFKISDIKEYDKLIEVESELEYWNDYRQSTYIKGYEEYMNIKNKISDYGIDESKIWSLYDKFVQERRFEQNYKYAIAGQIAEYMNEGLTDEQIRNRIMGIYNIASNNDMSFENAKKHWDSYSKYFYDESI